MSLQLEPQHYPSPNRIANMSSLPIRKAAPQERKADGLRERPFYDPKNITLMRSIYDEYLAAYKGESSKALGWDSPRASEANNKLLHKAWLSFDCVLILSTSQHSSIFLPDVNDGRTRAYYHSFSQNPFLSIKFSTAGSQFEALYELNLTAGEIEQPAHRSRLNNLDEELLDDRMSHLALPKIQNAQKQVSNALRTITSTYPDKDIQIITFKVRSNLKVRKLQVNSGDVPRGIERLHDELSEIEYITVLRTAQPECLDFMDEFWDYILKRCMTDGIYWGYKLDRDLSVTQDEGSDEDSEDELSSESSEIGISYSEAVVRGHMAAPYLTWMRDESSLESVSHSNRPWFTSTKELDCVYRIMILHDVAGRRTLFKTFFGFSRDSPVHSIHVEADTQISSRFLLKVTVTQKMFAQMPKIKLGTKFDIRACDTTLSQGNIPDLKAYVVGVAQGNRANFTLEVMFDGDDEPWGNGSFYHGARYDVKLRAKSNPNNFFHLTHSRQLRATQEFVTHACEEDKEVFCGNGPFFEVINDKGPAKDSFINKVLVALYDSDLDHAAWNELFEWRERAFSDRQEKKAILAIINSPLRNYFAREASSTTKHSLAGSIALYFTMLSMSVLVTSPNKSTAKTIATHFAKHIKLIPGRFQAKVKIVCFSSWGDSMKLIHDWTRYKTNSIKSDSATDALQLWQHVYDYATELTAPTRILKNTRAERFLVTFNALYTDGSQAQMMQEDLNGFKKDFKYLATNFLKKIDMESTNLIVVSTCNNAASLAQLQLKFHLLVFHEAEMTTEIDMIVPMQIEHEKAIFIGDDTDTKLVHLKTGHMSEQHGISFFRRIMGKSKKEQKPVRKGKKSTSSAN